MTCVNLETLGGLVTCQEQPGGLQCSCQELGEETQYHRSLLSQGKAGKVQSPKERGTIQEPIINPS
jgi:hypothetical protein